MKCALMNKTAVDWELDDNVKVIIKDTTLLDLVDFSVGINIGTGIPTIL